MTTSKTPPIVSGGLPIVGHAIEMMRDRNTLFDRGYKEHGDVFAMKLGPQATAVVTGLDHNKLVYTETDKALNMQDGYTFLKEALGEVLFTASQEAYYNQRPVLQEVFKRKRMVDYIEAMNVETQRWLDGLGESGEVDFTQEMLQLAQYIAGHAFIGKDFEEELGIEFWRAYDAISESLDFIIPPNWPLPKFKRRDKAKKVIRARMQQVIDKRVEHPDQYDDLITTLLATPQKDGTTMSHDEIATMFMGLIFAGHETTAGQAAWGLALLLQHPDYLQLIKEELATHVTHGESLTGRTLSQLEYTYWAIDETTRIRPSADVQIRTATQAIQVGEYEIPAGWRVMVNAQNSHFLPEIYTDPEKFDPLRYSPDRQEGKNSFHSVGFGGGIHKCTGMNFAKNEMAVITARLFQQFDVELLSDKIETVAGKGANRPSAVNIRYRRKPVSEIMSTKTAVATD